MYVGFQMDLYCNRKTKTGPRTPGMERNGSKWRGRFTLLSLLVTLLLTEGRMLLATFATMACCWHVFTLQPTWGVFVQSCFAESGPQAVLWPRVSPPRMPTCAHSCRTWWGSCQTLSPACWHTWEPSSVMSARPLKDAVNPFTESSLCHITHIAQGSSVLCWSVKVPT